MPCRPLINMPRSANSGPTTGREVHEWIDDPQHKDERHDITKIPETFQMFKDKYGEEAVREYVQHLADDLNGKFSHLIEDIQARVDTNLIYLGPIGAKFRAKK